MRYFSLFLRSIGNGETSLRLNALINRNEEYILRCILVQCRFLMSWERGIFKYLDKRCMQFITRRVCNIYDVVLFFRSARRYFYVCHMFIYFVAKIAIPFP